MAALFKARDCIGPRAVVRFVGGRGCHCSGGGTAAAGEQYSLGVINVDRAVAVVFVSRPD